jgi:hypothetical protein
MEKTLNLFDYLRIFKIANKKKQKTQTNASIKSSWTSKTLIFLKTIEIWSLDSMNIILGAIISFA